MRKHVAFAIAAAAAGLAAILSDAPGPSGTGTRSAPVNVIVLAGATPVVGTDLGVFLTTDGGATWLRVGRGLPRAPVMDIRHHRPTNRLYAATFGRGMWRVQLPGS